jgi:chemotaxis protein CheD
MKDMAMGHLLHTTGLVEPVDAMRARVFLRPGDWLVGLGPHEVSTLLGSCVSVVLWAPGQKIGGMCHCLLPHRPDHLRDDVARSAGHYVDEALAWMTQTMRRSGVQADGLQISLVGGGCCTDSSIGELNVQAAKRWLAQQGWRPHRVDVGGAVVRKLNWSLATGELHIIPSGRSDLERG